MNSNLLMYPDFDVPFAAKLLYILAPLLALK